MVFAGLINGARDARWLTRERIIAGGQVLLLIELTFVGAAGTLAARRHFRPDRADIQRLCQLLRRRQIGVGRHTGLAYDQAAHFLTEQQFTVARRAIPVFLLSAGVPVAVRAVGAVAYYVAF